MSGIVLEDISGGMAPGEGELGKDIVMVAKMLAVWDGSKMVIRDEGNTFEFGNISKNIVDKMLDSVKFTKMELEPDEEKDL